MANDAAPPDGAGADPQVTAIARFMGKCSFEATRPSQAEIEALGRALPGGARLFLTAIPGRPLGELEQAAALTRANGLTPVPHLSARHFLDLAEVERHLRALVDRAAATDIMLVGGDVAEPRGAVRDALAIIESGLLEAHGIRRVGLAGFPDGHPKMDEEELEANLVTKLAALQSRGLEGEIVTQFCFDSRPILKWLEWLRQRGVNAPVRIGLAGPTSLLTWLNYARRCGVKASAEALASRSGLIRHAFKAVAPDPIIRALSHEIETRRLDNVEPHLFAFGGIEQTVQWAKAPMSGRISLNRDGGFDPL